MRKTMLILAVFGLVSLAWAADPFVGTWKMNSAKSKFTNMTLKSYVITQDDSKVVQDMVDADGKAIHRTWVAEYDGKEYPVTAPDADAISLKKPNANTIEYVVKNNKKKVWSGRALLSKDGKTYTDTGGGKDAKGQAYTYSIFMEKQ
jgi:hypothetical protein